MKASQYGIPAWIAAALACSCAPNTTRTTSAGDPLLAAETQAPPPLAVAKIAPATGTANSKTIVAITGTGFKTGATVMIGDQPCNTVVVYGPKTLTCAAQEYYGGTFAVTVTNSDGESSQLDAAFTYSGAPTFTFLSKDIFAPICASCHIGMLTYSAVALRTTPGNADTSPIIIETSPAFTNAQGQMPLGSSLTPLQLQGIRDWITAGSKND
jgi:IPT/TIG domain